MKACAPGFKTRRREIGQSRRFPLTYGETAAVATAKFMPRDLIARYFRGYRCMALSLSFVSRWRSIPKARSNNSHLPCEPPLNSATIESFRVSAATGRRNFPLHLADFDCHHPQEMDEHFFSSRVSTLRVALNLHHRYTQIRVSDDRDYACCGQSVGSEAIETEWNTLGGR